MEVIEHAARAVDALLSRDERSYSAQLALLRGGMDAPPWTMAALHMSHLVVQALAACYGPSWRNQQQCGAIGTLVAETVPGMGAQNAGRLVQLMASGQERFGSLDARTCLEGCLAILAWLTQDSDLDLRAATGRPRAI